MKQGTRWFGGESLAKYNMGSGRLKDDVLLSPLSTEHGPPTEGGISINKIIFWLINPQ